MNYNIHEKIEKALNKKAQTDLVFERIASSEKYIELVKMLIDMYNKNKSLEFIFSGVGKNWYICQKVVKTFLSMGLKAQALDPVHALHGDLGMLSGSNEKVLFFISKSGTTEELVKLEKVVHTLSKKFLLGPVFTVSFSFGNPDNENLVDYKLSFETPNVFEFDSKDLVPSLSIDTMQLLLDLLGVLIYESDQTLIDSYVYNHLAGANGKKLGGNRILNNL